MKPMVRVTGVLIEDDRVLLVEQDVTESRRWSLPGGALEFGETLEGCLLREIKEETGLDVSVNGLLYVCDRILESGHVVHITLSASVKCGVLQTGHGAEFAAGKIRSVKWVPIDELESYGFSRTFSDLAKSVFPDKGAYKGNISNIGL
jgi:ADP-ribose pyrophosphatase YjhB (NUDIX family)